MTEPLGFIGVFEGDNGFQKLCDRLRQYYIATPASMGNKLALTHWKDFMSWCVHNGYTSEDINRAKRARNYEQP